MRLAVLREVARTVGVVPNAAYRHFTDREELRAAVCIAAMGELADRMAAEVSRVRGRRGVAAAARRRLRAVGRAYLAFARTEPGLFATAFSLPPQHSYEERQDGSPRIRMPLDQLRDVLDELTGAGVLAAGRREGLEYSIWSTVHGLAVLTVQGPLRELPQTAIRRLDEFTYAFIEDALEPGPSRPS